MRDFTFFHCSDIHLGKTYAGSPGEKERYEDFFLTFSSIIERAVEEAVDAVVIAGDLFHDAQVLPQTLAKTVAILEPLKKAGIPAIAVEGNHDWIHRRENVSWLEALSHMGYLHLLRPERTDDGGYRFPTWDADRKQGGHLELGGINFYGLGYIGAFAARHVPRIVEAIQKTGTEENVLLFHIGVLRYCWVDIGSISEEEFLPLANAFKYVALGHGHKAYTVEKDSVPFAFNAGSPECVNFGEEEHPFKGFNRVIWRPDGPQVEPVRTAPRLMFNQTVLLDGCQDARQAEAQLRENLAQINRSADARSPVVRIKLTGTVGFRPFELSREKVGKISTEVFEPIHVEYENALGFSLPGADGAKKELKSLAELEREVIESLFRSQTAYRADAERYTDLAIRIKEHLLGGHATAAELLDLIHRAVHRQEHALSSQEQTQTATDRGEVQCESRK
jgi:DNA repair exonuclease SbcCD nuclease subunit